MSLTFKKEPTKPQLPIHMGYIPPQDVEAERAVIGACLLERETFNTVAGIVTNGDCFYDDAHQKIFSAMLELWRKQWPVDLLTVTEELRRSAQLESIGGAYALTQLSMAVLSSAHVEAHARIIMEKFFKREIIRVAGMMITNGYDETVDFFDLYDNAKFQIDNITKDLSTGEDLPIGRIFAEVVKELEYQKDHKSALTGVDTGLYDLNEITNGWQNGDLIIIGARPSKGKTALALNLALSAAISTIVKSVGVGIFSLEMASGQLVKRMVSTVTGIDFGKIISGNLTENEFSTVVGKSRYFNMLPIRIADKVYSLQHICAKSRKWKEKYDIGLIVIDYLQLIKGIRQQGGNREQEISGISRELKLLAKELNVPVILLSQLNRQVEGRGSAEPQPADLRESGAIEQDADVIMFPWHGEEDSFISVAKNRNGKTAVKESALKIKFAGSIQKWMDPQAFEPFKEVYVPENARAGITNNYQRIKEEKDEDTPF